jgi:hypothetical protein
MTEINPYQPPEELTDGVRVHPSAEPDYSKFRSTGGWTTVLVLLGIVLILGNIASGLSAVNACSKIEILKTRRDRDAGLALQSIGQRQMIAGFLTVAVGAIAGLCFIAWVHTSACNLDALGGKGDLWAGWAPLMCLVPLFNLFMVPWLLNYLAIRSQKRVRNLSHSQMTTGTIIYGVCNFVSAAISVTATQFNQSDNLNSLHTAEMLVAAACLFGVIGSILWLQIIASISRSQDEWYAAEAP